MTVIVIGLIVIIVGLLIALLILVSKRNTSPELTEYLKQTMESVRDSRNQQQEAIRGVSMSLEHATTVIQGVQRDIGELTEIGRAMQDLQEYINNPKLRGTLGEHILSESLHQMLPVDLYTLQYRFAGGEIVDAAIFIGESIIPVDAKFPIQNSIKLHNAKSTEERKSIMKLFERDVKKHIDAISQKYIRTEEKTVDYAIMYIPSEAVYYEVVNNEFLITAAREQRVIVVSPMTFYAFLRAVLMSMQGIRIQQEAKEILAILEATRREYDAIEGALGVLDRHVTNAYNQLREVNKYFVHLGQRLSAARTLSLNKKNESK